MPIIDGYVVCVSRQDGNTDGAIEGLGVLGADESSDYRQGKFVMTLDEIIDIIEVDKKRLVTRPNDLDVLGASLTAIRDGTVRSEADKLLEDSLRELPLRDAYAQKRPSMPPTLRNLIKGLVTMTQDEK